MLSSIRGSSPSIQADLRKHHLSVDRQRFVLLVQRLGFGTIRELRVRAGEPVLDPLPRVRFRKKNGSTTPTRPPAETSDFALKREWLDFYADLEAIGDGVILSIEVAHGLPLIHEFEGVIPV